MVERVEAVVLGSEDVMIAETTANPVSGSLSAAD